MLQMNEFGRSSESLSHIQMNSNAEMMADERVWWSKQWQTNVNLLCIFKDILVGF